jgi:hypothetical protein
MLFRTLEIKYKIIIILSLLLCGETGYRSRYNNSLLADIRVIYIIYIYIYIDIRDIRYKMERRVAYSVLVEKV